MDFWELACPRRCSVFLHSKIGVALRFDCKKDSFWRKSRICRGGPFCILEAVCAWKLLLFLEDFCCVVSVFLACRRARFSVNFVGWVCPRRLARKNGFQKPLLPFPNKWIPEMGVPPAISSKLLSFFFDRAWYQLLFEKELLNYAGARQSDTEERCYLKVELQMACHWRCYN